MLSPKQQRERDKNILRTVQTFLEYNCRISDEKLSEITKIPRSTIGRYLSSERTKELIGIDNFAYIKRERNVNKRLGCQKGGSRKKHD